MKKLLASLLLVSLITACNSNSLNQSGNFIDTGIYSSFDISGDHINGSLQVNGSSDKVIEPGAAASLSFNFSNSQTNEPIKEFEIEHEKYMHLIVVSSDLSSFVHLHPTLNADSSFSQGINSVVRKTGPDPDNLDAVKAVSKPGNYLLFGEVKPKGIDHPETVAFGLTAKGQASPVALVPDQQVKPGLIEKYLTDKGEVGKPGDKYKITAQIMKMGSGDNAMVHLNLTVQQNSAKFNQAYQNVTNLEKWLGMLGHGILISQAGNAPEEKVFKHLHAGHDNHGGGGHGMMAMSDPTGPKLEFMLMGKDIPPSGIYKLWGQFKHQGKILTTPFIFNL